MEDIGFFVFPDSVWMIEGDSIKMLESYDLKYPALLFWLDSTKCTPCDYDMLYNFDPYYSNIGDMSFYVIVTPSANHKTHIDYAMTINDFPFPVIVDTAGSFYNRNKQVGIGNLEYVYIYLDEKGVGNKYVLSCERMEYDLRCIIDYCTPSHR
ncbi:MAG: hypothetical protein J6W18_02120 [Bacteroidaceae bacterium]|nr:hypothetical protein [Bacteroidaceae bacterium]